MQYCHIYIVIEKHVQMTCIGTAAVHRPAQTQFDVTVLLLLSRDSDQP